jgi:starch phosphorylase
MDEYPRIPNEASGTSGQKADMNGVINFSVLDGWWKEGFNGANGWVIGDEWWMRPANSRTLRRRQPADTLEQDRPVVLPGSICGWLARRWIAMIRIHPNIISPI